MIRFAGFGVLALLFVVAFTGCDDRPTTPTGSSAPATPAPTPAPTPTPTVPTGIRYDNIRVTHQLVFGTPTPSQNVSVDYGRWPLPFVHRGRLTYRLRDFPPGLLPSGGTSNVISASEMILVALRVDDYDPRDDAVSFEWHRLSGGRPDAIIYTFTGPDTREPSQSTTYWSYDYSYVGRFSWEIDLPGSYYVVLRSAWGDARIDFAVVD